jgi:hypothetical protein
MTEALLGLPEPSATGPTRRRPKANGAEEGHAYGDAPLLDIIDRAIPLEVLAGERRAAAERAGAAFPEPEDRGRARLSPMGEVEYVEDLIRPGRIVTWAAEEGSGKSYAVTGELAIRFALAGGSFAETWRVLDVGPVLVLSEMHSDDDFEREERILAALGRSREELTGGLYRLPLMTAAGGAPALTSDAWRAYITSWCRSAGVKLMVFDTATGATQVEPWGTAIQEVFRNLRALLDELPELAVICVVHLRKPHGRGTRAISDVLGEWGRWCDVVVLMEADGLHRVKLTTRKRVRREHMISATKRDGLLVEPQDLTGEGGPKVPLERVVAAVEEAPGIGAGALAKALGVTKRTALTYSEAAEDAGLLRRERTGLRGAIVLYPAADRPRNRETPRNEAGFAVPAQTSLDDRATAQQLSIAARSRVAQSRSVTDGDGGLLAELEDGAP